MDCALGAPKRPARKPKLLGHHVQDLLLGVDLAHAGQERHAAHVGAGNARGSHGGGHEQVGVGALAAGLGDGALHDVVLAVVAVCVEQLADLLGHGRGGGDAGAASPFNFHPPYPFRNE